MIDKQFRRFITDLALLRSKKKHIVSIGAILKEIVDELGTATLDVSSDEEILKVIDMLTVREKQSDAL